MIGHKLWQVFRERFDTWVTIRSGYDEYARYGILDSARTFDGVGVLGIEDTTQVIEKIRPNVVVNAIGIIKQVREAQDSITSLTVNALFPHLLARECQRVDARLIHISTDCVFSGRKGQYVEDDVTDAEDLYGRSKLLGEVDTEGCLTVRTGAIGRELSASHGLVEWFLGQSGRKVQGYVDAIYSGFPTVTLAGILADVIDKHPELSGLYQVSSDAINKYALLGLVADAYGMPVDIERFSGIGIDRSLESSRFRSATGFAPQPWEEMVKDMAADPTPYDEWRLSNAS
jgi:dTDP-4-dehydrorhamnose reductase